MPLIDTLTRNTFCFDYAPIRENFTLEAREAIFEWYDDFDENIEFYPLDITYLWSEYDNVEDVLDNYDSIKTAQDLEDHTMVLYLESGGVVIMTEF